MTFRILAALVVVCTAPSALRGQYPGRPFASVAGGTGLEDSNWSTQRQILGVVGEVAAGVFATDQLGIRVGGSWAWFHGAASTLTIGCGGGATCLPPRNEVGVLSLTGDVLMHASDGPSTTYFLVGGGAARFYHHPSLEGTSHPMAEIGIGEANPLAGRLQFMLEIKYRRVFGTASPRWDVPLVIGLRV